MVETSETVAAPSAADTPSKKVKKAATGVKKPKSKPTHPSTSLMVDSAITELKERGGSSLSAIKKYMAANYKVDVEKSALFIRKYLRSAVASGKLVQTKGKGASGSFKLPVSTTKKVKNDEQGEKKKSTPKKPKTAKKENKSTKAAGAAKKTTTAKKAAGTEKKKAVSAAAKGAKKAGTVKAKAAKPKPAKAAKSTPAKKKAPAKPKKAASPKKAPPKKAAKK